MGCNFVTESCNSYASNIPTLNVSMLKFDIATAYNEKLIQLPFFPNPDCIMDLKADLDSYLSRSSNGSKISLSNLAQGFKLPTLPKSPFSDSSAPGEDAVGLLEEGQGPSEGWFGPANSKNTDSCSCLPSLSKKQRIIGFMTFLGLGVTCFSLALAYIPVLMFYARKFSLLFSLGSVFTMFSFSFLWGPVNHVKNLFGTRERLPFTTVYLVTLFATLYFAMGLQSTVLTVIAASAQVFALLWFVLSFIPGGQTGIKWMTKMCTSLCKKSAGSSLPI